MERPGAGWARPTAGRYAAPRTGRPRLRGAPTPIGAARRAREVRGVPRETGRIARDGPIASLPARRRMGIRGYYPGRSRDLRGTLRGASRGGCRAAASTGQSPTPGHQKPDGAAPGARWRAWRGRSGRSCPRHASPERFVRAPGSLPLAPGSAGWRRTPPEKLTGACRKCNMRDPRGLCGGPRRSGVSPAWRRRGLCAARSAVVRAGPDRGRRRPLAQAMAP